MEAAADTGRRIVREAGDRGWSPVEERSVPYGRLFRFERGAARAIVTVYDGKRGVRIVPGGAEGALLAAELGLGPPAESVTQTASRRGSSDDPFGLGTPRVGADESGKGDWFGPLVVAAVWADAPRLAALQALGAVDSKRLSSTRVLTLAAQIEQLLPHRVLSLAPRDYNRRYDQTRNLDRLLSAQHGAAIRALAEEVARTGGRLGSILIDRFTTRTEPLREALGPTCAPSMRLEVRGEADPVVAAASILARAAYLDALTALGHEYGMTIPPGAGEPTLAAGVAFMRTFGNDALAGVAKLHFATTRTVLARYERRQSP